MIKKLSNIAFIVCITFSLIVNSAVAESAEDDHLIQIAVLLDTSNSMDGLIHQAKTQLWSIVNELATAKKNGKLPQLEVALYEYGNDSLSSENGYVRRVLDLTTDLDKVSEELFALKTNGGTEYCGWVIEKAVKELKWSKSNNDFKAIYIAGNEPFNQMPGEYANAMPYFNNKTNTRNVYQQQVQQHVQQQQQQQIPVPVKEKEEVKEDKKSLKPIDYRVSCKVAIESGIIVNTIHCGEYQTGIDTKWRDGATIADGIYMNIDQNRKVIDIKAPQDVEILKLNEKLNGTYIPYGTSGFEGKDRQEVQDKMAKGSSYNANVQRAISKSSFHYRNSSWDLVDACRDGNVDLEKLKEEELPEKMKKMSVEERKAYIESVLEERRLIQEKIQKLTDARKKYVAEKMKEDLKGEDTLESAITKSLRDQLEEKEYSFGK